MDIDGPEFILEVNEAIAAVRLRKTGDMKDTFSQQPTTSTCFQRVAVIDTNFLISNLSYLQHLLTEAEKHPDVLLAIIPWTVVLELDGLKSQQREGGMTQLEERARRAIRFLEATLQRKSSGLRGQRRDEVYDRNTAQTAMIHHIDALSAEDKTRMVDLLSMVAKGEKV
ncbi:uncharacterized protein BX664DRAFT_269227 [Halteromyces radiatus]|uniref:uncharacterized protein n=1 Tax=Halteromyces radiatus TaxID=101107 RepID=UPI00222084AD|nr:uncharacterized protein BX664DRAFT_269227 [Halteromyces radiatus]KAI8079997.1 hypothetical protein BX664DRAFT_269227 [Halteromyces radiatus]